ncbi:MAG: O-antigen ligase family protein [Bacteroidales bacterium]|nr:O-antigen ligase family protein [Bacteroidales bacterium]MCF8403124.1 O-antigen ligase family protein [Bacteroidales bacterium]
MRINIQNKVYYYGIVAIALLIPLNDRLASMAITLVGLNWIVAFNFKEKFQILKQRLNHKKLLALSSIYIVYFVSLFYSKNTALALESLEVKLSLLVFPLLFSTTDFSVFPENFIRNIQKAFIAGCFINSLLLFNSAVLRYFQTESTLEFYYGRLSLSWHASYLALFYTFAIILLAKWVISSNSKTGLKWFIATVLILYFQIFIILLSSKAGILGLAMTYVLATVFLFLQKPRPRLIRIFAPAFFMMTFLISMLFFPPTYQRFITAKSSLEAETHADDVKLESSVARMLIWKSAFKIIKENPLVGVGAGDVKPELMKRYLDDGIVAAYEKELNAHCQYIQTYIATGLLGFILLLFLFIVPGFYAVIQKDLVYFLFLALFALHISVESMFERQAGVVFYAFFNAILYLFPLSFEKLRT